MECHNILIIILFILFYMYYIYYIQISSRLVCRIQTTWLNYRLHSVTLCYTVLHCVALCYTVLHSVTLCSTVSKLNQQNLTPPLQTSFLRARRAAAHAAAPAIPHPIADKWRRDGGRAAAPSPEFNYDIPQI